MGKLSGKVVANMLFIKSGKKTPSRHCVPRNV
jgi:hypothetical protein